MASKVDKMMLNHALWLYRMGYFYRAEDMMVRLIKRTVKEPTSGKKKVASASTARRSSGGGQGSER